MNSEKNIYEELLKEHPELKESNMDIQDILTLLQKMKPEIIPDENFKQGLKIRLENINNYGYQKKSGFFSYMKFVIPVFTFGFVLFGFMYFGTNSDIDIQQENMRIESDERNMFQGEIQSIQIYNEQEDIGQGNQAEEGQINTKNRSIPKDENNQQKGETINNSFQRTSEDISEKLLDTSVADNESMQDINSFGDEPIMMQQSMMMSEGLDIPENIDSQPFTSEMMMQDSEEQISEKYLFLEICSEYNGSIKQGENNENICVYQDISCSESSFEKGECMVVE